MAGKNLSPRQKMINMMYLVLTALLALQVSSGVLEKFMLLDKSLDESLEHQQVLNRQIIARIKKSVEDSGSRKQDVEVLNKAFRISKNAGKIIDFIKEIRSELIKNTGGKDAQTGRPKGLKNESAVTNLMINHKKADTLKKLLNDYCKSLVKETGKHYNCIAVDAKDNALFKNDPNQKSKSFSSFYFEKTPLAATLAMLNQFSTQAAYNAGAALEELARSVGAEDVKFDKLFSVVCPQSNVVVAGTKYTADLLLTASSSGIAAPEMTVNGRKVKVVDGVGKVEFPATAKEKEYKNGMVKRTFDTKIKVRMPNGTDTVLKKKVSYFVAKPVIQVQSDEVSALYLKCGNNLTIQVPALGSGYKPTFKATGGAVIQRKATGAVTIIPSSKEINLKVYQGKELLGSRKFKVRGIPRPRIRISDRGKRISEKNGVPAPGPRSLRIRAIADESFKALLPQDANYRVKNWEIFLVRGKRIIDQKKVNSQEISLSDFASRAKPGDRIVVEVKKIERLNFKKEIESVQVGIITKIIPLT